MGFAVQAHMHFAAVVSCSASVSTWCRRAKVMVQETSWYSSRGSSKTKKMMKIRYLGSFSVLVLAVYATEAISNQNLSGDWTTWGRDAGQSRFSPLTQITPENVNELKPVWAYDPATLGSSWETTPIVVQNVMYFNTRSSAVAVDPETGKEIWKFSPGLGGHQGKGVSFGRVTVVSALAFSTRSPIDSTRWMPRPAPLFLTLGTTVS